MCQEFQQWSSGPVSLTGYCQGTVISKLTCGEDLFCAYRGCRSASGSHWLLSGDINSWSCGLLLEGCSQPSSLHSEEQRQRKRWWARKKSGWFQNLIFEVKSHHFCGILFIRSKSLDPPNTQERELHKGKNTRKQGSLGPLQIECATTTGDFVLPPESMAFAQVF